MTADYLDNGSTRKKYLAPLVVIMLCAVALTGAAYAYSTTVTGNGDIKGEYTIIDIYETGTGTYEATSSFDIVKDTIQFYTVTNKTGSTWSYRAYVEDDSELVYKAYLRINTTNPDSKTQKFLFNDVIFNYSVPTGCGSIMIAGSTGGEHGLDWGGVKIYTDSGKGTPVDNLILTENTYYYLELTLTVTGGLYDTSAKNFYFCDETSFEKVQNKVNTFNTTKNELTLKIGATPTDSTQI